MRPSATPRDRHHPLALVAVLAYVCLAAVASSAVILASPGISATAGWLAGTLAVASYAAERTSERYRNLQARNVALGLYVLAALVLPPPWALVIAAIAIIASHMTSGLVPTAVRIVSTAHVLVVSAVITVAVHLIAGESAHITASLSPWQWLQLTLRLPLRAPFVTGGDALGLISGVAILPFVAYCLDAIPMTCAVAIGRGLAPWNVWNTIFRASLFAELAVPCLGILIAATYVSAPAAALLCVPPLLGAGWVLTQANSIRSTGLQSEDLPGAAQFAAVEAKVQETKLLLGDALSVVRHIGSLTDLSEVNESLTRAATRLTQFRACTLYLYDASNGLFVPCHSVEGGRLHNSGRPIGRDTAEMLMSLRHRRGYSYFTPVEREPGVSPSRWRVGDMLIVPLVVSNGDVGGFLSLAAPADGQIPVAEDLSAIEAVASLGAAVISRLRHADEVLHMATVDPLTGLMNRRALEERLQFELETNAFRRPVALMVIDLDDFGSINNAFGHQIGDAALRLVSGVIQRHLRQSDAGARYGGDEFVVILPGLDDVSALEVAERVRAALVEAASQAASDSRFPQIYTSIGVAVFPGHGGDASALFKAADDALYRSKRLGKNRVSLHAAA